MPTFNICFILRSTIFVCSVKTDGTPVLRSPVSGHEWLPVTTIPLNCSNNSLELTRAYRR